MLSVRTAPPIFIVSPNTVVEYSYTTSRPDLRSEKGFDSEPADLSESNPRVSMLGFETRIENAHHQEVSVSHRIGKNNIQLAAFSDRVTDPALTGTGEVTAAGGFLLPDVSSGTFSYAGPDLNTKGLRVVLQRKFSADLTATVDYAMGGVLDLSRGDVPLDKAQQWISTQRRHAVAAKLSGTVAAHPYQLDRVLSLDQWFGYHAGRHVQLLGGTKRSIPQCVHPPADSTPRRTYGGFDRHPQSAGPRIYSRLGAGRADGLPCGFGALHSGRIRLQLLASRAKKS